MLDHSDILIFKKIKEQNFEEPNGLKKFYGLIKYFKGKGNFKFAFSNGNGSLHKKITIRENLDLEAIPTSISLNTKIKTKDIINSIENEYLQKLIARVCPLERTTSQLNAEELKLASLIKGIISQTEYLFLDSPSKGLSETNLNVVKKCLLFEASIKGRIIIISDEDNAKWMDIANKVITKNNGSYEIVSNRLIEPANNVSYLKVA